MNTLLVAAIGLVAFLSLVGLGTPIAFAMALVGFLGSIFLEGPHAAFAMLGRHPYIGSASYALSVLPLFVLMGQLTFQTGLSRDLYKGAYKWVGHWPGGLAYASILGCAFFAAISGSSAATTATIGSVAIPEMRDRKYDPALATGSIASAGMLGILIPPSVTLVVYGLITEESVGKLLVAGILPGILLTAVFVGIAFLICKIRPQSGPPGEKSTFREKIYALRYMVFSIVVFFLVIGGIYLGWFTPNEAAAIGCSFTFLVALGMGKIRWKPLVDSFKDAGATAMFILMLLIGAGIFNHFMAISQVPQTLARVLVESGLSKYAILLVIVFIFVVMGTVMDSMTLVLLMVPTLYPLITSLGFSGIWFGILVILMTEQGLLTPPVGVNVYIVAGLVPDVPVTTVFRGIVPYVLGILLVSAIVILFPEIALFLPNRM